MPYKGQKIQILRDEDINAINLDLVLSRIDENIRTIFDVLGGNDVTPKTVLSLINSGSGGGGGGGGTIPGSVGGGGGGGIIPVDWTDLNDTPSVYTNKKGIAPNVNLAENALEFSGWNVHRNTLPSSENWQIQSGYQLLMGDEFDIQGTLTINGSLVVVD